jgi:hypothetical protein
MMERDRKREGLRVCRVADRRIGAPLPRVRGRRGLPGLRDVGSNVQAVRVAAGILTAAGEIEFDCTELEL